MTMTPLVSCIMPTYNRRRFAGQAIWYFLRQDYPQRELVIMDDGEDAIDDLVPQDERIRYMRLQRRLSVGAKRNLACQLSQGELIAHWDDDDWMASQRLSVQVAELLAAGADACGTRDLLHYHLEAGEAWCYSYPADRRPWLAGGTLLYRRSTWAEHPFPDRNVGEDTAFIWQLAPERLHVMANTSLYVAIKHSGNTAAKSLASPRWQRRPLGEVSQLLMPDRDFYLALRNGRPLSLPRQPSAARPSITVVAPFLVYDGYGSMAEYLVLGMARAGAMVRVTPLALDLAGLSAEFRKIVETRSHPRPDAEAPILYFCWPQPALERFRRASNLFINTMWENSRLPAGWAERLNQARAVIVPTRFVAQVCRESGVTAPVEVVPEGVDPDVYHYEERPPHPGLTTLMVGTLVNRKHTLEGIAAWKLAFGDDPEARLIIKARFKYRNYIPDDPRISFIDTNEAVRGIAHWYRQADVLLALGNEGFGLPLVEGMATGLPVIALNSEGQADVCQEAADYLLPVEPADWEMYDEAPFGRAGLYGVPGEAEVASSLRWVAGHGDEAREMGRSAADWVRQHRNVWSKGPAMLDVIERYTRPGRPLRRADTLWVSSWGQTCGVAEYTTYLTRDLPAVRVVVQLPDMSGVRLLHIQHEPSLFHNGELLPALQQAHRARIPIIVTEHAVQGRAQAWEREVDALVALTQAGADRLRARWPDGRIYTIPHGCMTWFPPRKRVRGQVIGVFGFLEPHKGFWQLLDVLRQMPGTELLMFSYAKSAETERRWTEAARGLPVRRVGQFLPVAKVARQLAAEADILVYWYDEAAFGAASGAIRIGLATGVPVLTSPTGWFHELRQVTYQPEQLLEGTRRLLEDTPLREDLTAAARAFCHENSWPRIAQRHLELWRLFTG
ncbi:MAG: glycosyltransferase [Chloroflexi bacterium]|nr:glycosyltransferase [Chloroflexota bacterium]MCI0575353.1 glycosyltransferase [Chloroflexota bacterium]MCI0645827.1 glycosyltransferase [Chloroflexota bacterium]MCI0730961.1 glycosyltransferase [Chloroflexota bacterium]